jgi:uncharacterized membrane protein
MTGKGYLNKKVNKKKNYPFIIMVKKKENVLKDEPKDTTKNRTNKKSENKSSKEGDDSRAFAFLGVFLLIIGFVLVLLTKKENKYSMYYAKQGLVLFGAFVAASFLMFIPVVGWVVRIFVIFLWVLAMVNSLSGEMKSTPIIGVYAEKLKV